MAGFFKGLIMPSNFAILCVVIGIILLFFHQYRKQAITLLTSAGVIIGLFSTGPVASLLLSPLEYEFPSLTNPDKHGEVRKVVVLTHYVVNDPLMPLSSRMSDSTAYRLLEVHRLHVFCPGCEILISGKADAAAVMKQQLIAMTVPEEKIVEDVAPHTYNSAANLKQLINDEPFFLVTSAGHMPRSMGVFRKQGMRPIPVPTDFHAPKNLLDADFGPSPQHLYRADLAVNEYLGILWYQLTGKI